MNKKDKDYVNKIFDDIFEKDGKVDYDNFLWSINEDNYDKPTKCNCEDSNDELINSLDTIASYLQVMVQLKRIELTIQLKKNGQSITEDDIDYLDDLFTFIDEIL